MNTNTKSVIREMLGNELKSVFARRVGVGRPALYHWLDGSTVPDLTSVVKLAAIATDDQLRRLYAAVGLRLPECGGEDE